MGKDVRGMRARAHVWTRREPNIRLGIKKPTYAHPNYFSKSLKNSFPSSLAEK